MSRVLLEADNLDIWRQEVQTAIGGVQVDRYVVKDQTAASFTIATLPCHSGEVLRVRAIVLAKQIGGSAGTIGNSATYELLATFKNLSGTLTQVGTTTVVAEHEDDTDWNAAFTITSNILTLTFSFNGATASTGLNVVCNAYSYLHTLKAE